MSEDIFVQEAFDIAHEFLKPPLLIRRGAVLLYQIAVNNRLQVTVDPRTPTRGDSAFQTDLCVFEQIDSTIEIPRVVMEFKSNLTTHDVLTYSAKARKHKQVYTYLRYGLVISNEDIVPGRFFTHNEALDFCIAGKVFIKARIVRELLAEVLDQEVAASRLLEKIAFGATRAVVVRNEITLLDQNSLRTIGTQI